MLASVTCITINILLIYYYNLKNVDCTKRSSRSISCYRFEALTRKKNLPHFGNTEARLLYDNVKRPRIYMYDIYEYMTGSGGTVISVSFVTVTRSRSDRDVAEMYRDLLHGATGVMVT